MPLYWTREDKDLNRPIASADFNPLLRTLGRKGSEEIDYFERAVTHDVDWVRDQVSDMADRMSNPFPWLLLGSTYVIQGVMIFGPTPPPVKAAGIAWAVFPMADPFTLSVGYAIF